MGKILPESVVVAALTEIGLFPISAQTAAADTRITWTEQALIACVYESDHSTARNPAANLWLHYLLHGRLPPLPKVKPADDDEPDTSCPVCKGDVRECRGLHGFVLKVPCWICHKPLAVCKGACTPMVATTRRSTRNKRREDAA
jgi:hypothetical protein